jgi:hypothetical protein
MLFNSDRRQYLSVGRLLEVREPGMHLSAAAAAPGNACGRKLLSVSDVGGILQEPITGTAPLEGDPQTCYFVTATTESEGGPK